jgi:hypothetical protein
MFGLLRHIGHTSRYEIPPRPAALRAHLHTDVTPLQELRAALWRCRRTIWDQKSSIWTQRVSMASSRSGTGRPRGRTSLPT